MKLIYNAYYHKDQIKFEFRWRHFHCSRGMPLYKWKKNKQRQHICLIDTFFIYFILQKIIKDIYIDDV